VFREEISVRHRPHVGITQRLLISKRAQVFIWYLKSWTKHNLNLFARMNILLWWLCPRPPDPNTRKAETLSFLHVLLVWGVNLLSLLIIYVQTMRLCF
jgi:hypothetical protein